MSNLKISICIPTYNRASFLETTLKMFIREFDKAKCGYEILIGDNASEDNTREVVEKFVRTYSNIRYFRHKENLGITRNLNFLFQQAEGKYIWLFGDDDLVYKNSISFICKEINKKMPNIILLNTDNMMSMDEYNREYRITFKNRLGCKRKNYFFEKFSEDILNNEFNEWIYLTNLLSTIIVKRDLFLNELQKTRKVIDDNNAYQFQHVVLKIFTKGKILIVGKPVILHRKNETYWSKNLHRLIKVNLYDSQEVYRNLYGYLKPSTIKYYREKYLKWIPSYLLYLKMTDNDISKYMKDFVFFLKEVNNKPLLFKVYMIKLLPKEILSFLYSERKRKL